jgi:uncharacterized protein
MSGVWMITHGAREHYLSGCGVMMNEIDVHDVAWHLAQINRFTGACKRPYSVAEHSLLCADLAKADGHGPMEQMLCLVHDAHEAYTGDLSSPMKNAVGMNWAMVEHAQADRVRRVLGVATGFAAHKRLVFHYDLVALATERQQLTHFNAQRNREWPVLDAPGSRILPAAVNLNALERVDARWSDWLDQFLTRYFDLQRAIQQAAATAPIDNTI